jgi:hypothetical protein
MKSSKEIAKDLGGLIKGGIYPDTITRTLYATDASMFRVLPHNDKEDNTYVKTLEERTTGGME